MYHKRISFLSNVIFVHFNIKSSKETTDSESFTICRMPYILIKNVLSVLLNKNMSFW